MALVEMSVVEQRYRAVLAVGRGEPKIVVAAQFGVSRQTPAHLVDPVCSAVAVVIALDSASRHIAHRTRVDSCHQAVCCEQAARLTADGYGVSDLSLVEVDQLAPRGDLIGFPTAIR